MLLTANDLSSFTLKAGEPFFLEVQFQDSTGAVIDLTDKAHVLSFYRDDRSTVEAIDGEQLVDATGLFLRFARDGRFSEELYGQNLMVELTERYLHGREVVATGRLTVERSAAGVPSFDSVVTKFVTRITIKDNLVLGGPPAFTQQKLLYRPDIVPPKVTLGALSTSGTLRVGTASNGTIVGATAGSTIAENVAGLAIDPTALTYTYDGTGPAGLVADALVETHPNATNSPRSSALTLAAAPITLTALSLAASSVTENEAAGVVVGGILGKTAGSTLSLVDDDGGRFAISGTNLVAGLTAVNYEEANSRSIVLRETLAGATNSPRDTALAVGVVNVFEQPSLRALLLSSTSLRVGTAANGAISEAATGSTITAGGLPAGFTVNGPARTWAYDGSGPASNSTITLTETLGDSPNSPRSTQIGVAVAAPPAAFTMTQLSTPIRIYPRTTRTGGGAGAGTGAIPVALNVTQAGTIYARTRSTASGNPILQAAYLAVASAPVANGPVSIGGLDARLEEFFLDLSPDGTTWTLGTTPVGMGAIIGYAGQSLQVDMMVRRENVDMTAVGEAYTTLGAVYYGSWGRAGGATPFNSAGANALIRLHATRLGCRVALVGRAEGSTAISQWVPGQTLHTELLTALADQAGNRIEAFSWYQGHEDALQNKSAIQWAADLSAIMGSIDAQMVDQTFPRLIATIPNVGTAYGTVQKTIGIRNAGKRWCELNPRAVSVEADDLVLIGDFLHQSQAGARRMGFHKYRSLAGTDIGPRVIGRATKSGAVLTMQVDIGAGATALTTVGDPLTRMAVFRRALEASGDRLPLASYALGPVNAGKAALTVTLSNDPGDINLDFYLNPKLDPGGDGSTGIILNDNTSDGVPVGRQLTSLRPIPVTYPVPLVGTNAAYSAGGAFGVQGLSGGRAVPATTRGNVVPGSSGWRVECWVNVQSASTDNTILWFGNDRLLMVHAYDLRTNDGTLVKSAAFVPGLNHFSFSQLGPNGAVVHINGVPTAAPFAAYGDGTVIGIRGRQDGFLTGKDIVLSQVAVFARAHLRQSIDVPTAAYTGAEAGLLHLWPLNGSLGDLVAP